MMRGSNGMAALVLSATGLMLAGCAGVERPEVELVGAGVSEQTVEGARVELAVRLENPNEVVLPLPRVRYSVAVEGAGRFDVSDDPAVALSPGGGQTVILPAAFEGRAADWAGRRFELRGMFSYRPPGQIRALLSQYGIPLPVVPFAVRGELREMGEGASARGETGAGEVSVSAR